MVIPLVVVEELDGLKKAEGERGCQRESRNYGRWRNCAIRGDLLTGVSLPGGGQLHIEKNFIHVELPS